MSEEGLRILQGAWQLAMRREQDAFDLYSKLAHETANADLKALFTELAGQEAEHKARLVREYRRLFESGKAQPLPTAAEANWPIVWMDWNADTFRLAEELDLPVLLNISAKWCRWCRSMDEQSYKDPEVSSLINGEFVPVRVDNDRRPDINSRYNMGGWPSTVVLTPTGQVLTGRTYVAPEEMTAFLRKASEYYHVNRFMLEERLQQSEAERREINRKAQSAGPVSLEIVEDVVQEMLRHFDGLYGGFGDAPKLPNPDALELALAAYHRTGDRHLRRLVELTLSNMATGGLFDHEEGGFFRYSTTKDWAVPAFEKMLKDNAKLLRVYLQAYQEFGRDLYEQTARKTIQYLNTTLYDQSRGIFYGSQAADEQYYNLPLVERRTVEPPAVDQTAFTHANAMAITAYLEAGVVLQEPAYTRQALGALDFLWRNVYEPGMGMFHYYDGAARMPGLLVDQVWMARALLHGYQYTGRPDYLEQAEALMKECVYPLYADPRGPGYFDCVTDADAVGRLQEGLKNINENALAAEVSTVLFRLTGDDIYRQAAESALYAFGQGYVTYGYFAARYALVIDRALRPYVSIVVAGGRDEPQTERLLNAGLRVYAPNRLIQVLDPVWERDKLEQMGLPAVDIPAVHVYQDTLYAEPVFDPERVAAAIAAVMASG